jgi:16S rRNA G1207 methylase RsmC
MNDAASGRAELTTWCVGDTAVTDRGCAHVDLVVPDGVDRIGRIGVHEAVRSDLPRVDQVLVRIPAYRGKSLVPALAWLVATRLAGPAATVTWLVERNQGPKSLARMLSDLGWTVTPLLRRGGLVAIETVPPATPVPCPVPTSFEAERDGTTLRFAADYGVFSPGRIDDGTALLIDFALDGAPVDLVADIGIGYGAIALSLVAAGRAAAACGTDVDCIALALAQHNAETNGIPLDVVASPDPLALPPTPLTVCNIPTHIDAAATDRMCEALAARAHDGAVAIVVHASLEQRYVRRFAEAGVRMARHPGPAHVVLRSDPPRGETGASRNQNSAAARERRR